MIAAVRRRSYGNLQISGLSVQGTQVDWLFGYCKIAALRMAVPIWGNVAAGSNDHRFASWERSWPLTSRFPPMLPVIRAAAVWIESRARCAYRAVVWTCV